MVGRAELQERDGAGLSSTRLEVDSFWKLFAFMHDARLGFGV